MRILGFGTYDVRSHPRVGVILDGLRAHSHTVRELNRPLGVDTAARVEVLKSPLAAVKFGCRLAGRWASLAFGSLRFRGHAAPDAVVVGYLGHFDVILARLLFPRATIVLDHLIFLSTTAQDRHLGGGMKDRLLAALDRLALSRADIIVLDTPAHADLLDAEQRQRAVVVPVGAPDTYFAARDHHATVAPSSVIFYGLYTPLQGAPTIARALAILEQRGVDLGVTLVGTGQDYAECRRILENTGAHVHVTWRDWVDADELPAVVAQHDVCLGIFGTSDKALRVVPNKVYQGAAAGCAVVTSDTAPQRAMLGDAAIYVEPGNAEALADALAGLNTERIDQLRRVGAARADAAFTATRVVSELDLELRRVR